MLTRWESGWVGGFSGAGRPSVCFSAQAHPLVFSVLVQYMVLLRHPTHVKIAIKEEGGTRDCRRSQKCNGCTVLRSHDVHGGS